ncbi:MAG: S8 family serine peptidase, partial [Acidobacteria bacterium]|nr:S8 family serine peptidase [Acidobacteriota bacterium]
MYSLQWHLKNTGQGGGTSGQDADVESVWSAYQGSSNEVIAIVDDGLEIGHEDLAPNVVPGLSRNYVNGSTDPTPANGSDGHGTSVAGVAAARGSNGIGVSGAAPFARLAGFNFLAGAQTEANEADALSRSSQIVDIYSNSWGPNDGGDTLGTMPALVESALASGVANGRGGRGNIYIWAAGNGGANDDSNYDGYANSRYTIAVAASTNTGVKSSYSEEGANILVNAPSNGGTLGITTTDLTGSGGYNPNTSSSPAGSTNYTSIFGGTSSAAPLVAGITALVLQANPNLRWRDVRAILAVTAAKNSPNDSGWTNNTAGYHVHPGLGFGRVDAQAAVTRALSWTNLGTEQTAQGTASPNVAIPDSASASTLGPAVSSSITIASSFNVEFAEVRFSSTDHTYWADLQIELTSPSGTKSVLAKPHGAGPSSPLSDRYDNWRFGSVRHLGENAQGTWTLTVRDGGPLDVGTFQQWTLKLYGSSFGPAGGTASGGGGSSSNPTLTVSVTGSGTVSSSPAGIACGTDCSEPYSSGSAVTLTPTPSAGSVFAGWGGSSDCYDGQVTVTTATGCTAVFTPLGTSQSTRFVDLTGEGIGDTFFYNPSSGAWSMAFATGTGGFNFFNSSWSSGWTVTPGYFNSDALIDFFLYNSASGQWVQALNNGAGGFTYTNGFFSPGWQVFVGRFNGDTIDDVFVYNPQAGTAVVCFVNGSGNFSGFRTEGWSGGWDIRLARLNADALTDVFLYNRTTGQYFRCLNTGSGFTYTNAFWSAQWSTTIADFNGDGLDDVFLYNESSGQWFQCLNNGADFTYTTESWSGGWRIARGRLNQDGRDDLF